MKKILITGGSGFIGSNFIHYWLEKHPDDMILNLDKLTYAGHPESLKDLEDNHHYMFVQGDICEPSVVERAMQDVDLVIHFAAESHVDRSVLDPMVFVKTNVLGTGVLLEAARKLKIKRFHHISTDEVFGHLGLEDPPFNEDSNYRPRTPYSSSKAGSDLLVRAYHETYGLPMTITNCANNFGPFCDPEKLIPRFITNLMDDKKIPLMGDGSNIRPWLYVKDHCRAIETVLDKGEIGETYCVKGTEKTNLEVTKLLLELLGKDESMIEHVEHRLGHDLRYALDSTKLEKLGWQPEFSFEEWLSKTVEWYKQNEWWWRPLKENRPDVDPNAQRKMTEDK